MTTVSTAAGTPTLPLLAYKSALRVGAIVCVCVYDEMRR